MGEGRMILSLQRIGFSLACDMSESAYDRMYDRKATVHGSVAEVAHRFRNALITGIEPLRTAHQLMPLALPSCYSDRLHRK